MIYTMNAANLRVYHLDFIQMQYIFHILMVRELIKNKYYHMQFLLNITTDGRREYIMNLRDTIMSDMKQNKN